MEPSTPEEPTLDEIREEAAEQPDDPVTSREEFESRLLALGKSEAGAAVGDEMD